MNTKTFSTMKRDPSTCHDWVMTEYSKIHSIYPCNNQVITFHISYRTRDDHPLLQELEIFIMIMSYHDVHNCEIIDNTNYMCNQFEEYI